MVMSFETVDVKQEIHNQLTTELQKFGFGKVKVIKADPQSATEMPCIGINRVDDSESMDTIADHVENRYDKETNTYYQVYGTYFQESLEIRVWHTNADERDRLYRHVKAILFAIRLPLVEKGLLNIKLRSGKDEQDSSMAQAPMVLYWAPITMSYLNPMNVTFTELVEPITSIADRMKPVVDPTDI